VNSHHCFVFCRVGWYWRRTVWTVRHVCANAWKWHNLALCVRQCDNGRLRPMRSPAKPPILIALACGFAQHPGDHCRTSTRTPCIYGHIQK
jgi:hypothetical protein